MRRVAVVGCGDVSIVHFEAIARLADVELWVCATWICGGEGPRAVGRPAFHDHRAPLAAVRPDVAHVCTPHDQHAPLWSTGSDAGVAVIVEKPLAATMPQAERILAAADQHPEVKIKASLPEPLQRDHSSDACSARERCRRESSVGTARCCGTAHRRTTRPVPGGDGWSAALALALINQAIHTVDLLQWLLGDVTGVDGHVGRSRAAPGVDEGHRRVGARPRGGHAAYWSPRTRTSSTHRSPWKSTPSARRLGAR